MADGMLRERYKSPENDWEISPSAPCSDFLKGFRTSFRYCNCGRLEKTGQNSSVGPSWVVHASLRGANAQAGGQRIFFTFSYRNHPRNPFTQVVGKSHQGDDLG
jgi:hypothetical protein